jgi:hypothetical protein
MRKYGLLLTILSLSFILTNSSFAQGKDSAKLKISGYIDAYYALYNDSVGRGNFQKFPTVSPINNNFGLNIAQVTFKYDGNNIRGNVILHYGDIPRSAWASDFNVIQKAHVGVRIFKDAWIDVGFFRTHFGTEGLLPKENICSSISTNTFYEPYFESGVRLDYAINSKWVLDIYVLNGYNMFTDNNDKKSLGVLVNYTPNDKINVGYSNYLGDDTPDPVTTSHFRIHQNVFFNYQKNKVTLQAGGDFCLQQNSKLKDPTKWANMASGVGSIKYSFKDNFSIYGRVEIFNDPDGFMSTVISDKTGKLTGYKIWGVTGGLEYKPNDNSYIRLEGRQLQMNSDQEIFRRDGMNKSSRGEVMLNMGVSF